MTSQIRVLNLSQAKMGEASAAVPWWEAALEEVPEVSPAARAEMGSLWSLDLNVLSFMCCLDSWDWWCFFGPRWAQKSSFKPMLVKYL